MDNLYSAPQADLAYPNTEDSTYEPNIFSWSGRIGRLRLMAYTVLYAVIFYSVLIFLTFFSGMIFRNLGSLRTGEISPWLIGILVAIYIPITVAMLTLIRRRLNDINLTGWFGILAFVPFVNFIFFIFLWFAPGTNEQNKYGPVPCKNSTGVIIGALGIPLVMVVIIGILAAIAIPAYSKYVERAKAAQELSQQAPTGQMQDNAPATDAAPEEVIDQPASEPQQ